MGQVLEADGGWYPSIENEISKNAFEPVRLKLSPVCSHLNM